MTVPMAELGGAQRIRSGATSVAQAGRRSSRRPLSCSSSSSPVSPSSPPAPARARCTPADGGPSLAQINAALRAHPRATLRLGWRWRGADALRRWRGRTDAALETARAAVGVQVQAAVLGGLRGRGRLSRGGIVNPDAPFISSTRLTTAVRQGLLEAAERGDTVVATRPPRAEGIRPRARRSPARATTRRLRRSLSCSAAPAPLSPCPSGRALRRHNTAPAALNVPGYGRGTQRRRR